MKGCCLLLLATALSCASLQPKHKTLQHSFDKEGHRGCRGLMPENTIPAMIKALDLGVNTLEMDVVITADSQVLLSHDPYFNHELTTKPGGSYVTPEEEKDLNIFRMTYAETQRYDVGSKPHPRFPTQQKMAVTKPLLAHLIDSVEQYGVLKKLPPVWYNIETKSTAATDNLFHPEPTVFVKLLMQVIAEKGIEKRVIIQSFDVRTLQVLHKNYPGIKTSLLIEEGDTHSFAENIKHLGFTPNVYSPYYELVNADLVSACKASGVALLPWTVNSKEAIVQLKKMGVDGVITDYPDLFAGIE